MQRPKHEVIRQLDANHSFEIAAFINTFPFHEGLDASSTELSLVLFNAYRFWAFKQGLGADNLWLEKSISISPVTFDQKTYYRLSIRKRKNNTKKCGTIKLFAPETVDQIKDMIQDYLTCSHAERRVFRRITAFETEGYF